jgi:DNA-directed RNA polymerase subunit N (RpoN/RPB10)
MAVECGDVIGQKLRIFVRRVCQQRYIPEDVLSFLQLTKNSGDGPLAIQSLYDTEG